MLREGLLNGDSSNGDVRSANFTSLIAHSEDCSHTSTIQKDLILDAAAFPDASLALSLASLPSPPLPEYVSLQRCREQTRLRLLCLPLKPVLLVCICFLTLGSYFVYDEPGALSGQLAQWFGNGYSAAMNANLYSVYSVPNVALPFFSGIIVDRWTGVRGGAFLFIMLITVGNALFSLGVQLRLYGLALAGRFVFGLGGESLTVVQNCFVVRWFDGAHLALAFSLVLAFARVGTSVNFIISPLLALRGVPVSIWMGACMTLVSFAFCCAAAWIDFYTDSRIARERRATLRGLPAEQRRWVAAQDRAHEPKQDAVSIRDIRRFPVEAWLLFVITVFFYIGVLTFYTVAQDILTQSGRKYSAEEADLYISIPSFVSILATPAAGIAIDRRGRALYWIVAAAALLCFGHVFFLLMAYDVQWAVAATPVPVMLWIGVAYAMGGAAVWPILSYVLEPQLCGTGYGMMTAVQNAGLALFPLIIAGIRGLSSINGTPMEYVAAILVFVLCEVLALVLTLALVKKDAASGKRMNASAQERTARKAEEDRISGEGKTLPHEDLNGTGEEDAEEEDGDR